MTRIYCLSYSQLLSGTDVVAPDAIQTAQLGHGGAVALGNLGEGLSAADGHAAAASTSDSPAATAVARALAVVGGGIVVDVYLDALVDLFVSTVIVDAVLQVNETAHLCLWQAEGGEFSSARNNVAPVHGIQGA